MNAPSPESITPLAEKPRKYEKTTRKSNNTETPDVAAKKFALVVLFSELICEFQADDAPVVINFIGVPITTNLI